MSSFNPQPRTTAIQHKDVRLLSKDDTLPEVFQKPLIFKGLTFILDTDPAGGVCWRCNLQKK